MAFLDAIASLDWGMRVSQSVSQSVSVNKPFSTCNHCKMLSYLLDIWSCSFLLSEGLKKSRKQKTRVYLGTLALKGGRGLKKINFFPSLEKGKIT